jgi:hypothetical protein
MKLKIIVGLFAILLLGGTVTPAISQTAPVTGIVINEVEINPPGNDASSPIEWIELFNPTDTFVDISGWQISTSSSRDTFKIPQGTIISPGEFLLFFYTHAWFTDVSQAVQLLDEQGNVIDETPPLTDVFDDTSSWQRRTDGLDTDSSGDWINKFSTPGKTISREARVEQQLSDLAVSISADKDAYLFGEYAKITGQVSKIVYIRQPTFVTDTINMKITGPDGYSNDLTLFPDYNLKFRTILKLDYVLEINAGLYNVSVEYGGVTASTQFTVGNEVPEIQQRLIGLLSITTDETEYIPDQRITMTGHSTDIIPFESLKYTVRDRSGAIEIEGSLFPNQAELDRYKNTNRFTKGGTRLLNPDSQFILRGFIDSINPVYGTYKITAEYGEHKAETTFDLVEDLKEDKIITLLTDKQAYGLGDTVTISGRLNNYYVPTLDLEILQTDDRSLQGSRGQTQSSIAFKKLDGVRLEGDSTFEYQYKIPLSTNALGDWRVLVKKDIGTAITFFTVVENPEEWVPKTTEPFFVTTDKDVYDIEETIQITGRINDIQYLTDFSSKVVKIEIQTEDGLSIINPTHKPSGNKPLGSLFTKTAIPDPSGNYWAFEPLYRTKYAAGNYIIKAIYDLPSVSKGARVGASIGGTFTDTVKFTIRDTLYESGIDVKLDKLIYGLGEEVHLTGTYPLTAQGTGIQIKLTQPDGVTREFGKLVDDGRFSWSWQIPKVERTSVISPTNDRTPLVSTTALGSNYGVYLLNVGTNTGNLNLSFKVSPNPEEDFLSLEPITVSTEKPVYQAAEKLQVRGTAQKVQQGNTDGLVVPYRVEIFVESTDFPIKRFKSVDAFLDNGGNFKASADLPPTVFQDGIYKVTAIYQGHRAQNTFEIENQFFIEEEQEFKRTTPIMLISTDKEEYERGETVAITTRPNKNIWLETIRVALMSEESTKINCGSFVCGPKNAATTLRPDERTASYYHEEKIPNLGRASGDTPLGTERKGIFIDGKIPDKETYFAAVEAEFGVFTKPITVWNIPKPISEAPPERFTEKFNRITESHIDIDLEDEKIIQGDDFHPRVIQGSLFTPNRGQESEVNMRVTTQSGVCLIGPEPECTVRESTRAPGVLYQAVTADGNEYKVRYNGHEAKLEKFTILPVDPEGFLEDLDLDVDILKEDQSSNFYYKATYVDDD